MDVGDSLVCPAVDGALFVEFCDIQSSHTEYAGVYSVEGGGGGGGEGSFQPKLSSFHPKNSTCSTNYYREGPT